MVGYFTLSLCLRLTCAGLFGLFCESPLTTIPQPPCPPSFSWGNLSSFNRLDFQVFFGASVLAVRVCRKLSLCRPLVSEFEAAGGWPWHFCRAKLTTVTASSVKLKVLQHLASPVALFLAKSTAELGPSRSKNDKEGLVGKAFWGWWWWKLGLSLNETRFPLGIKRHSSWNLEKVHGACLTSHSALENVLSSWWRQSLEENWNFPLGIHILCVCVCSGAKLCLTLCNPMDCSPPGSSVHGFLQARILEWVTISSSRASFPTQGSSPHLLPWEGDSLPLSHLRRSILLRWINYASGIEAIWQIHKKF